LPDIDPLKQASWWIADLRNAEDRKIAYRYGEWLLQCEMSPAEAQEAKHIIDKKLTWPRSKKERELMTKWAAKVVELEET